MAAGMLEKMGIEVQVEVLQRPVLSPPFFCFFFFVGRGSVLGDCTREFLLGHTAAMRSITKLCFQGHSLLFRGLGSTSSKILRAHAVGSLASFACPESEFSHNRTHCAFSGMKATGLLFMEKTIDLRKREMSLMSFSSLKLTRRLKSGAVATAERQELHLQMRRLRSWSPRATQLVSSRARTGATSRTQDPLQEVMSLSRPPRAQESGK